MSNFFSGIAPNHYELLTAFIDDVEGDVETANVESILTALDQLRTTPQRALVGLGQDWGSQAMAIQEQLTLYILERFKAGATIQDNWASRILATCGLKTTVISMNYDNVAERILSGRTGIVHAGWGRDTTCPHCKMRLLLNNACSCEPRREFTEKDWQGSLLKPHGSIAWRRCLNSSCCSYECLVADAHCRPFEPSKCPNCGSDCAPALVLPSMNKNLSATPEIEVMWRAAQCALEDAESVLVFGFSFPSSDALFRHFMRKAICKSRKLKRLGVIDINPECVIERVKKCFPSDYDAVFVSYPVVSGRIPPWIASSEN